MADRPLAFHAAPPPGQWINDPNGLVYAGGAYRLFAQHRADAPMFRETGWARFSSPDLLRWTFDGAVIPPDGAAWNYSGSILAADGGLAAVHTVHTAGSERQVRRASGDGGAGWGPAGEISSLGSQARNRRDPFVFRDGERGWALLLAEPCDWTAWRDEPASRLRLYRSGDGSDWRDAGAIGPWHPPGVMWEVPVMARVDGRDVLFVSTVDRRDDGARCAVTAWIGDLDDAGFTPDPGVPAGGQPVDFGPDFYAMMPSVEEGWPRPERCFVAWAGAWGTARAMRWPGFHGGPITLPRALSVRSHAAKPWAKPWAGPWLASRPIDAHAMFAEPSAAVPPAGMGTAPIAGAAVLTIAVSSDLGALHVRADMRAGVVDVERTGTLPWTGRHGFPAGDVPSRTMRLFLDGPLVELFLPEDGAAVTAGLEKDGGAFTVEATVDDRPLAISWMTAR